MRRSVRIASRACSYEFEDAVAALSGADLLLPAPLYDGGETSMWRRLPGSIRYVAAEFVERRRMFASLRPDGNYDLAFVLCHDLPDARFIRVIRDWRRRFGCIVLWIEDIWPARLRQFSRALPLYEHFDHVVVGVNSTLPRARELIGPHCCYLPPGVDALRFAPRHLDDPRPVDICYIGRRLPPAHRALLELAEREGRFYWYDTVTGGRFVEHGEHRRALAALIQRSRFFIANRARVDMPEMTGGLHDVGFRHFEGAAAGAVMLGEQPDSQSFRDNFNWPDAVIDVAADSPLVAEMIPALERQPDRLRTIRRRNIVESLRRHDWVYRWAEVCRIAGFEPGPACSERMGRLAERAAAFEAM